MSIRSIINLLLGALAVVAVLAVGVIAVDSARQWQGAERAVMQGQVSELLLRVAGEWAAERGLTAGALGAAAAATPDLRKAVAERRQAGDAALAEALARLPEVDFPARADLVAQLERRRERLASLRRQADADLGRGRDERTAGAAAGWFPASSAAIEDVLMLRLGLIQANSHTPLIAMAEDMRSQLAVMAEYAGRERGYVNAVVAAGRPLAGADMAVLGEFRGRVLGAWEFVRILARQERLNVAMAAPVAAVEDQYFGVFEQSRVAVAAAGLAGQAYPLAAADWFAAASGHIP